MGTGIVRNKTIVRINKEEKIFESGKTIAETGKLNSSSLKLIIEVKQGIAKIQIYGIAEKKCLKSVEPTPLKNCWPIKNCKTQNAITIKETIYVRGLIESLYMF